MNIEEQIADYKPYNEQEAHDQAVMRQLLVVFFVSHLIMLF